MNSLSDAVDYSGVPYLEEILNYLPIDPDDGEKIVTYVGNLSKAINVNYQGAQYKFAYFGLHLLYMTYIYCSVWKISKSNPGRYNDAVILARPHDKQKLNSNDIESIFDYSYMRETELPKIFKIVGLDNSQIGIIVGIVKIRNDIAHATGNNLTLKTNKNFNEEAKAICISMKNIHECMKVQIIELFKDFLLKYCHGKFTKEYSDDIENIISEQMIKKFYLSKNELLVCNEMILQKLPDDLLKFETKLDKFKQEFKTYCEDNGYL